MGRAGRRRRRGKDEMGVSGSLELFFWKRVSGGLRVKRSGW